VHRVGVTVARVESGRGSVIFRCVSGRSITRSLQYWYALILARDVLGDDQIEFTPSCGVHEPT